MKLGDLHNFGQRVSVIRQDNSCYYLKPRSVIWEWLFFSLQSPLRPALSKVEILGHTLSSLLLNLDVEITGDLSGKSLHIEEYTGATQESHYIAYGAIIAYSYVYGLMDLLAENIIKTNDSLQGIDLEVVLTKVILPHQTLVMPYKAIPWEKCAGKHIQESMIELSFDQKSLVLKSFIITMVELANLKIDYNQIIPVDVIRKAPVRIILRFTKDYYDRKGDFLPEETSQLERGDIPYFFKYINSDAVFFYTNENHEFKEVSLQGDLKKNADQTGLGFESVMNDKTLLEKVIFGSTYLLKSFFQDSDVSFSYKNFQLKKSGLRANISYQNNTYNSDL